MKNGIKNFSLIFLILYIISLSSCHKNESSDSKDTSSVDKGTLQFSIDVATINNTSANLIAKNKQIFNSSNLDVVKPTSIASGVPDYFELSIKKMVLNGKDSNGSQTVVTIFNDTSGKPLKITGSNIDLSQLFTAYECYKSDGTIFEVPEGKSCKCGLDESDNLVEPSSDGTCPVKKDENGEPLKNQKPIGKIDIEASEYSSMTVTFGGKAKIKGCVSATFSSLSSYPGAHTYCTKTSLSLLDSNIKPKPTEFESTPSEEMDFLLNKTITSSDDIDLTFPIKNNLTIKTGEKAKLTLVIDANRVLRFYNMGRSDTGPAPGSPSDRAYFFTSVFEDSLFVFAGAAGDIKGWKWTTQACNGNKTSDYNCPSADVKAVSGWLTMIYDADKLPLAVNFMPDDDNTLTLLKGGNKDYKVGIDQSKLVKTTSGKYDLGFSLSEASGTVMEFDADSSLKSSFTSNFDGVNSYWGKVSFEREL